MNKYFLLLAVAITASFISQSQIVNKGDKLFGGSFSFDFSDSYKSGNIDATSSNAGFFPQVSIGIGKNLTAGIIGHFLYQRTQVGFEINKITARTISGGVGLFLKKYKALTNRFGIYFLNEINMMHTFVKTNYVNPNSNFKEWYWAAGYSFIPGVFYKFSDHFLGEAHVGGAYLKYQKSYADGRTFTAGVDMLASFNLGINYIIPRKG